MLSIRLSPRFLWKHFTSSGIYTTKFEPSAFTMTANRLGRRNSLFDQEKEELPANRERVRINVGGTVFETYLSTLTRSDVNVLSDMVTSRWLNVKEIFVDRNPKHFEKVLDYLRDSNNFAPPLNDEAREELRKEAEFYNLPGLVEMCSPEVFHVGDSVQWKQSSVEAFCKFFATYCLLKNRPVQCPICNNRSSSYAADSYVNYIDLLHVKEHMSSIRGEIHSLNLNQDGTICIVRWENWVQNQLPQSLLRLEN